MKTPIVVLSLVSASFFCNQNNTGKTVMATKAISREIISSEEDYIAPYKLKWFDKDLNCVIDQKFRNEKGC
ncbi:MAG: hypothetical protein ACXVC6_04100 [Bacteroidia bacterium]